MEEQKKQREGHLDTRAALERERDLEDKSDALTWMLLASNSLGVADSAIYDGLATAIVRMTEIATCQWGCRGGDHLIESLVARLCNYALAAIRLGAQSFYTESLALLRGLAEVANILQLFSLDEGQPELWRATPEDKIWNRFRPGQVRDGISNKGETPIVDQKTYSALCELAIHVSPSSIYSAHYYTENRVHIGSRFSIVGIEVIFNQMAFITAPASIVAARLVDAPVEKVSDIEANAERLLTLANNNLTATEFRRVFSKFRATHFEETIQEELSRITPEQWQEVKQPVIDRLIESLRLDGIEDQNQLQEIAFAEMYNEFRKRLAQRLLETDIDWFEKNSTIALAQQSFKRAKDFGFQVRRRSVVHKRWTRKGTRNRE